MLKLFLRKRWFFIVLFVLLILFKKEPIKIFAQETANRLDMATGGLLIRNPVKEIDKDGNLYFLSGSGAPTGDNIIGYIKSTIESITPYRTGFQVWLHSERPQGPGGQKIESVFKPVMTLNGSGNFFLGRISDNGRGPDGSSSAPDFEWDNRNYKFKTRSLILADIGDSPDLAIRRVGPDNAAWDAKREGIDRDGVNIGPIYWQALGTNGDFEPDGNGQGRLAQISGITGGPQTGSSRPGRLYFGTTSPGKVDPDTRMNINEYGKIAINKGEGRAQAQLDVNGDIATGSCKGCADLAEDYISSENLEAGDVVVIDENSNDLEVKKSSQPYDQKILGVVSSAPAIRISEDGGIWISKGDSSKTDTGYPIALTGRVPVKVSTENGAIKRGDYLTSSSVPGTAMKASKKGKVLGMALEGFNSSGTGKIKIFMDISWYGP